MNADRRKRIAALKTRLEAIAGELSNIRDDLEVIRDDEQEALDNLPEGIRAGDRGEKIEGALSSLEDVLGDIDGFDIESIKDKLDEAAQ